MDGLPIGLPIPAWLAVVLALGWLIKHLMPDLVRTLDRGLARVASKALGIRDTPRGD